MQWFWKKADVVGLGLVSEAMVIVGGTPESLEMAVDIKSGDLSCHSCDDY